MVGGGLLPPAAARRLRKGRRGRAVRDENAFQRATGALGEGPEGSDEDNAQSEAFEAADEAVTTRAHGLRPRVASAPTELSPQG